MAVNSDPLCPAPSGSVVRLRHLDASPVKAAICEAEVFQPTDAGPRSAPIHKQLDARLWSVPAAYCLLWEPESKARADIYVGSTGDPLERLPTHDQTGWTRAVIITGHGLTRGIAQQLEAAFGNVVVASDSAFKRLRPAWTTHPSLWEADMPWDLLRPAVVLLELCLDWRNSKWTSNSALRTWGIGKYAKRG